MGLEVSEVRMEKAKILMLIGFMILAAGVVRIYAEDPDKKQNSEGGSYFWCPWCDERQEYKNPNNASPGPQDYQRRYDLDVQKKNPEKQEITPEKAHFIMESYVYSRQNPDLKLGEINYLLDDYSASAEFALRALPVLVLCYGPDSPHVAVALNNLASAECSQKKLLDAQKHLHQALSIAKISVGQKSELYGMTALNLGFVCKELGNRKESATWYQKASKALAFAKGAQNSAALEAAHQFSMSTKKMH